MNLRPFHETVLEGIQGHCRNLVAITRAIADGALAAELEASIPPGSFEMGRTSEIGALCALLDVLGKTFVPLDKLDVVVEGLREVGYNHSAIDHAIGELEGRKGKPSPA